MRRALPPLTIALGLAACPGPSSPPGDMDTPQVLSVRDVGVVRNASLSSVMRARGGAAGRVGGKVLWTFGDTRFPFLSDDGQTFRSATAAYADFSSPTALSEPLDGAGAPFQLLPLTDEEREAGGSLGDRFALWPAAVLPKGENAMILYARVRFTPDAPGPAPVSTGFAEIEPFDTVAVRAPEIFVAPEPPFHHAAALDAGDVYLYACDVSDGCRVARAPYAQATERAAYTFWTGSGWSPSIASAVPAVPGAAVGFSLAYNTYLERFLSVTGAASSGRITMRVSERPEGPWSDALPVHDVGAPIEATIQHPELASEAGKTIFVSYAQAGELRLLEITLR